MLGQWLDRLLPKQPKAKSHGCHKLRVGASDAWQLLPLVLKDWMKQAVDGRALSLGASTRSEACLDDALHLCFCQVHNGVFPGCGPPARCHQNLVRRELEVEGVTAEARGARQQGLPLVPGDGMGQVTGKG